MHNIWYTTIRLHKTLQHDIWRKMPTLMLSYKLLITWTADCFMKATINIAASCSTPPNSSTFFCYIQPYHVFVHILYTKEYVGVAIVSNLRYSAYKIWYGIVHISCLLFYQHERMPGSPLSCLYAHSNNGYTKTSIMFPKMQTFFTNSFCISWNVNFLYLVYHRLL